MSSRPKQRRPTRAKPATIKLVSPTAKRGNATSQAKPPPSLRTISASEFAERFAHGVRDKQQSFTWFLGAGCSVTSGIPSAGGFS
jgi:hypothetical protein